MPWAIVCNQKKNPLNGDGVQVQVVVVVGHGVVVLIFAFFTFVLSLLMRIESDGLVAGPGRR
jgi:hypothetical protein